MSFGDFLAAVIIGLIAGVLAYEFLKWLAIRAGAAFVGWLFRRY